MKMKEILIDLIEYFYLSGKIGGELALSEQPIAVKDDNIFGELLQYYRYLEIKEEAFFGSSFFPLILLPVLSDGTKPETWGLQEHNLFKEKKYIIFACTTIDDLLYCDMQDERCPVYGIISGSIEPYPLSDSLHRFLSFYVELLKLEMIDLKKDIYEQDKDFELKKEFVEKVYLLIQDYFSEETSKGMIEFLLSGILHLIDMET